MNDDDIRKKLEQLEQEKALLQQTLLKKTSDDDKKSKKRKKDKASTSESENPRPKKKTKKSEKSKDKKDKKGKNDKKTVDKKRKRDSSKKTSEPARNVGIEKHFLPQIPLSHWSPAHILAPLQNEDTFNSCVRMFRDIYLKMCFSNDTYNDIDNDDKFKQHILDVNITREFSKSLEWCLSVVVNQPVYHSIRDLYFKPDGYQVSSKKKKTTRVLDISGNPLSAAQNSDPGYVSFRFNAVEIEPIKGRKPSMETVDADGKPIYDVSGLLMKNVFLQSLLLDVTITSAVEDAIVASKSSLGGLSELPLVVGGDTVAELSRHVTDHSRFKYPIIPISSVDIDTSNASVVKIQNNAMFSPDLCTAGTASILYPSYLYTKSMVPLMPGKDTFNSFVQTFTGTKQPKAMDILSKYETVLTNVKEHSPNTTHYELEMKYYPFGISFLLQFVVQVIQEPKFTMGRNDKSFTDVNTRKDPYIYTKNNTLVEISQPQESATQKNLSKALNLRNDESIKIITSDTEEGRQLQDKLTNDPVCIYNRIDHFIQSYLSGLISSDSDTEDSKTQSSLTVKMFMEQVSTRTVMNDLLSAFIQIEPDTDLDEMLDKMISMMKPPQFDMVLISNSSMGLNLNSTEKMSAFFILMKRLIDTFDSQVKTNTSKSHTLLKKGTSSGNTPNGSSSSFSNSEDIVSELNTTFDIIKSLNQANSQNSMFYEKGGCGRFSTEQMFISATDEFSTDVEEKITNTNQHKFSHSQWGVLVDFDQDTSIVSDSKKHILHDTTFHGVSLCGNNTGPKPKPAPNADTARLSVSLLKPSIVKRIINQYYQECRVVSIVYTKLCDILPSLASTFFFDFPKIRKYVVENMEETECKGLKVAFLVLKALTLYANTYIAEKHKQLEIMEENASNLQTELTSTLKNEIKEANKSIIDEIKKLTSVVDGLLELQNTRLMDIQINCCFSLLENIYLSQEPKKMIVSMMSFILITKFNSSRKAAEFTKDYLCTYIPYATQKLTPGLGNIGSTSMFSENIDELMFFTTKNMHGLLSEMNDSDLMKEIETQVVYPCAEKDSSVKNTSASSPKMLQAYNFIFNKNISQRNTCMDVDIPDSSTKNKTKLLLQKKIILHTTNYMRKRWKFIESYMPNLVDVVKSCGSGTQNSKSKKKDKSLQPSSTMSQQSFFANVQFAYLHDHSEKIPMINMDLSFYSAPAKNVVSSIEGHYAHTPPLAFVMHSLTWVLNNNSNFKMPSNIEEEGDEENKEDKNTNVQRENNDDNDGDQPLLKKQKVSNQSETKESDPIVLGNTKEVKNKKKSDSKNISKSSISNIPPTSSVNTNTVSQPQTSEEVKKQQQQQQNFSPVPDSHPEKTIFHKKTANVSGDDYPVGGRIVTLDLDEQLLRVSRKLFKIPELVESDKVSQLKHESVHSCRSYDQHIPSSVHHAQKSILSSISSIMKEHTVPKALEFLITSQIHQLPITPDILKSSFETPKRYTEETVSDDSKHPERVRPQEFSPIEQFQNIFKQVILHHANDPKQYIVQRPSLFRPDKLDSLNLVIFDESKKSNNSGKKNNKSEDMDVSADHDNSTSSDTTKKKRLLVDFPFSCFTFHGKIAKSISCILEMIQEKNPNNQDKSIKKTSSSFLNHWTTQNVSDNILKIIISHQQNILKPLLMACVHEDFFTSLTKDTNPSMNDKKLQKYGQLSSAVTGNNKLPPYYRFLVVSDELEDSKQKGSPKKSMMCIQKQDVMKDFLCALHLQMDTLRIRSRHYPFIMWIPSTQLCLPVIRSSQTTGFQRSSFAVGKDIHNAKQLASFLKYKGTKAEDFVQNLLVTEKKNIHSLTYQFSGALKLASTDRSSFIQKSKVVYCHMQISKHMCGIREHFGNKVGIIWTNIDQLLSVYLCDLLQKFMEEKYGYGGKYIKGLKKKSKITANIIYSKFKEHMISKNMIVNLNFLEAHSLQSTDGNEDDKNLVRKTPKNITFNMHAKEVHEFFTDNTTSSAKPKHRKIEEDDNMDTSENSVHANRHTDYNITQEMKGVPKITSLKESWISFSSFAVHMTKEDLFLFCKAASVLVSFFFSFSTPKDITKMFGIEKENASSIFDITETVCQIQSMSAKYRPHSDNALKTCIKETSLIHADVNYDVVRECLKEKGSHRKEYGTILENVGAFSKDEKTFDANPEVRNIIYVLGNVYNTFYDEKLKLWISKKNRSLCKPSLDEKEPSKWKGRSHVDLDLFDSVWMSYAYHTIMDHIMGLPTMPFGEIGSVNTKDKWILPVAALIFSDIDGHTFVDSKIVPRSYETNAKSQKKQKRPYINSDSSIDGSQDTPENKTHPDESQDKPKKKQSESNVTQKEKKWNDINKNLTATEKIIVLECVVKTINYTSFLGNLLIKPPKNKVTVVEKKAKQENQEKKKEKEKVSKDDEPSASEPKKKKHHKKHEHKKDKDNKKDKKDKKKKKKKNDKPKEEKKKKDKKNKKDKKSD